MNSEKKLNIKAIIIGLLLDTIGSFIAGFIISFAAGIILASKGVNQDQLTQEMLNSKAFMNILIFVGFTFTFLGGYVTAYIAEADELKHALIMGIFSLMISLLFTVGQTTEPGWFIISLFVIPFAVLGGYLRKITKKA
jgi:MFS family permease